MESSLHAAPNDQLESTRFSPREVLIWRIWLNATESALKYYNGTLSPEERNRAEQFRFENLRHSYLVCRGALRVLIGCSPKDVEFIFGQKGKPAIRGMSAVKFNVSHSGDLAVYAFTLGCELGVDVERPRELAELESIASRFFCAAETSELLSLGPELRGANRGSAQGLPSNLGTIVTNRSSLSLTRRPRPSMPIRSDKRFRVPRIREVNFSR
jgi:4'-phosphopantetheinyl transferase family protien